MTIDNKQWILTRTLQMHLEGLTQEEISQQLAVSEGTINAILKELMASDNNLELQREIATVCKKEGISPRQMASNLRFENAIKRAGYDSGKTHEVVKAINQAFTQDGTVDEKFVAKFMLDLSDLILKYSVNLPTLYSEVESQVLLRDKLLNEIEDLEHRENMAFLNCQVTLMELDEFSEWKDTLKEVGLDIDDREEVQNVLVALGEQGDASKIIEKLKNIDSLDKKKEELEEECNIIAENLITMQSRTTNFEQNWSRLLEATRVISGLLEAGIPELQITQLFRLPYIFGNPVILSQLYLDLEKYGKLSTAIFMKQLEFQKVMNYTSNGPR